MKNRKKEVELGNVSFITKLAGFEHTEYIKPNATKVKINSDDVPMYIGMNIKKGRLTDEIFWFLPKNISIQLHRSALTKKCLVLPYVGSVGDVAVFDSAERYHLASNVAKIELVGDAPFSTEYLYYFLKSPIGQRKLLFYIQGGIQKNITMDAIRKTIIPIQDNADRIVQLLSALDDKIELNNKINTELEQMTKTIYDYWFVQFEFPNAKGKPYKSSGGKMVWNEELKREVPEGWEVKKLGELGEFKNGINYDPSEKGDTNARIINVRNISSSNWFVSQYGLDNIVLKGNDVKNYLVTDKDILIARSGIPGATRIMYEFVENTIYCGFIIRYQVEVFKNKNYLFFCLKDLESSTTSKSAGTIMQNVNQDTLKRMSLVMPNESLISEFNKFISPIFEKLNNNLNENQKISELRDWLLPMLMNGQVMVGQAYKQVQEVLSVAAEDGVEYGKKK